MEKDLDSMKAPYHTHFTSPLAFYYVKVPLYLGKKGRISSSMVINGLSLYPKVDDSCGSLRLGFLLFPATREFFLGTPPP